MSRLLPPRRMPTNPRSHPRITWVGFEDSVCSEVGLRIQYVQKWGSCDLMGDDGCVWHLWVCGIWEQRGGKTSANARLASPSPSLKWSALPLFESNSNHAPLASAREGGWGWRVRGGWG